MIHNILLMTSVLTLLLNAALVCLLIKNKLAFRASDINNEEVISFVLIPDNNEENVDTELLQTEIIARGDRIDEGRDTAAAEK